RRLPSTAGAPAPTAHRPRRVRPPGRRGPPRGERVAGVRCGCGGARGRWPVPGLGECGVKVSVDPIACRAHGLCADLLPEAVRLDEWGYPVVASGSLPRELAAEARRAAAACPALALRLRKE